jgi:hypothetical protein
MEENYSIVLYVYRDVAWRDIKVKCLVRVESELNTELFKVRNDINYHQI